ncbi:MAG TPA: nuclear transport factor 2 family protein [Acidimicrobiales bacterium]
MDPADRIELHELATRYGDLVDARDWEGLSEVFTDDVVYGSPAMPGQDLVGIAIVRKWMGRQRHPIAHHITNIRVEEDEQGVRLRSRVILIGDDGTSRSGEYLDEVRPTPAGWRICRRSFTARVRPDTDRPA